MTAPTRFAGHGPSGLDWIEARATWAVYCARRFTVAGFALAHPATRYNSAGGVDIDLGVVTGRLLRSEARRLVQRLRRSGGIKATPFRVIDGKHPADVGSGWEAAL